MDSCFRCLQKMIFLEVDIVQIHRGKRAKLSLISICNELLQKYANVRKLERLRRYEKLQFCGRTTGGKQAEIDIH